MPSLAGAKCSAILKKKFTFKGCDGRTLLPFKLYLQQT